MREFLQLATEFAAEQGHDFVTASHLLAVILDEPEVVACFAEGGMATDVVIPSMLASFKQETRYPSSRTSPEWVFSKAEKRASAENRDATVVDLLYAIIENGYSVLRKLVPRIYAPPHVFEVEGSSDHEEHEYERVMVRDAHSGQFFYYYTDFGDVRSGWVSGANRATLFKSVNAAKNKVHKFAKDNDRDFFQDREFEFIVWREKIVKTYEKTILSQPQTLPERIVILAGED